MKAKRQLFTLHCVGDLIDVRGIYLARSPEEVARFVGGEFTPREGGKCTASKDRSKLGVRGTIRIPSTLFREPDATDDALGAYGAHCYHLPGGAGLLTKKGFDKTLTIREQYITQLTQKKTA